MITFEKLNKNEMKMIVGGVDSEISEEGGGGGTSYQCCPDLSSPNVSCSDCVNGTPQTLHCNMGTLRAC